MKFSDETITSDIDVQQSLSLVDRPQGFGTEPDVKEAKRALPDVTDGELNSDTDEQAVPGRFEDPGRSRDACNYDSQAESVFELKLRTITNPAGDEHATTDDNTTTATRLDETSNASQEGPGSTPDEREQHANLLKLGLRDTYKVKHGNKAKYTVTSNINELKMSPSGSKSGISKSETVSKRLDVILVSDAVQIISSDCARRILD